MQKKYNKITHDDRINIIYSRFIHNMKYKDIEKKYDMNYNSVRNITKMFRKTGRTDKKYFKLKEKLPKTKKVKRRNGQLYEAND